MKAQLVNKMMPAEQVQCDFNPKQIALSRATSSNHQATAQGSGSTSHIFRGSDPRVLKLSEAFLEGDDVKNRAEQLTNWLNPGGGLLGRAAGAALSALSGGALAVKLPVLLFIWGPFLMECTLSDVNIAFIRFSSSGNPLRAQISLTLKEEPSLLGLIPTNPTSGGLPGRRAHTVTQGERLQHLAARTYGRPGAWRAVAQANNIDDPFRVRAGDVVYLPAPDELEQDKSEITKSQNAKSEKRQ